MRRTTVSALIAILILVVVAPSNAIPAFSRKYGFNCGMCHVSWPRLNDFGQKYRSNGYQIPGQEEQEKAIGQLGGPPLALRTSAGYTSDQFSPNDAETETNQFQINGVDVLGGGLLGINKGFFLAYLPQIEGGNGVEGQAGEVEQANVILSRIGSTWFNARLGRYEALYTPFSNLRSITISPYEIYTFNGSPNVTASTARGSLNTFALSDTATGAEFTGWGRSPWQYAFGLTNGSRQNNTNDGPSDVYLRGAYVIGQGFGQTSGQRLGATAYFGQTRALTAGGRDSFNRLGFDANLNNGPYNAQLQFIQGRDNGAFNIFAPGTTYKFSGGFLQLNRFEMESSIFARYDWVNTPSEDNHDITRWTVGWRKHIAHPLMLQLEYSNRNVDNGASPGAGLTENFIAARLDWAF